MTENPFRPGTASVPPLLAGRDQVLNPVDIALASHGNNYGSFFAVFGPRGLGKTSVLKAIEDRARNAGWATISTEVRRDAPLLRPLLDSISSIDGLPARLARKVSATRRAWSDHEQTLDLKVFRRTARRTSIELPITDQFVDTVSNVVAHLSDRAAGLALLIDEVQNADPGELSILGPTVQHLSAASDKSVMIALAGLSSVPHHLAQAFTYSERWAFHPLENLSVGDAALALAVPARESGKPFTGEAVDLAAQLSAGYPFAVQLIGFNAWNIATGTTIRVKDVRAANEALTDQLASGLYTQRWHAASALSKAYLAAAAHATSSPILTSEISAALGREPNQLSSTRAALIASGTITSTSSGSIEEAIPGFLDFVRRLPDTADLIRQAFANRPNGNHPAVDPSRDRSTQPDPITTRRRRERSD
jgi:AAA ATPase domain